MLKAPPAFPDWSRRFFDPIPIPNHRPLCTLRDAAMYITALSKAEQDAPEWWTVTELLLLIAEHGAGSGPRPFGSSRLSDPARALAAFDQARAVPVGAADRHLGAEMPGTGRANGRPAYGLPALKNKCNLRPSLLSPIPGAGYRLGSDIQTGRLLRWIIRPLTLSWSNWQKKMI